MAIERADRGFRNQRIGAAVLVRIEHDDAAVRIGMLEAVLQKPDRFIVIDAQIALWEALAKGDSSRIYRLSFPISSLVALQSGLDGFLAVEKHLLVKQGIFRNTIIRSPVGFHLDDETKNEVDRLYEILSKVVVETQS